MGINRGTVLDLINDVHRVGGFKDYNSYSYLFNQVDTMPESKENTEPHWIPVTEPPKSDLMPYYATCRSKVDDRENWVIEGMYTKYSGWEYPPMVRDDRAEIIAWMPKELPEPYKGVTE